VTAIETYNFTASRTNTTVIDPLYALNVTSSLNYGNLAVEDYSNNLTANITNFGNMNINVSVYGYGGTDFTQGENLSMICQYGNISINWERYSLTDNGPGDAFENKTSLTSTPTDMNLTVYHRLDDSAESFNNTYWQLYVAPNPFGTCNGTVVFTAVAP
jgi:D-mannonate dehydratase